VPLAFAEFQDRLLVGVGNYVRLYELGKKKLLKKCETKKLTSTVTGLNINGQRIFVSTMNESFHILSNILLTIGYKPNENQFYLFADDALPRWLSCSAVLDYDTIAGCDKFENFFIYRIPIGADEENEEDPMGTKYKWDVGYLNGAAYKLDLLAQFHRGEMITQIKKCSLTGCNDNVILYLTSMGSIGVFMPFETREEVDFFVHLEMYMRMEIQPLTGRDHQIYRSVYGPVKCVVDGDLCEEYSSLSYSKQKMLSSELDKTPSEISKKIEEMRYKIL
jgi:splicing factor 3B subunit 3